MQHYIIQMGSGHPGEMGTSATEQKIFEQLALKNSRVLFCPFHHLDSKNPNNDYRLFKDLCHSWIDGELELIEFHKIQSIRDLKQKFTSADLIILGSGLCEPYLDFFKKNHLDRHLMRLFRQKKIHLMGYSAGSIALSHAYVHVLFFQEVFGFYNQTLLSGGSREQLDEMRLSMLKACSLEHRSAMQKLLQTNEPLPDDHPLAHEMFESRCISALNFLPEQVVLPHYQQIPYAMARHLQNSARQMPWLKHYGLPNGVALMHTYEDSGHLATHAIGQNPIADLKLTRHFPNREETYAENQRLA